MIYFNTSRKKTLTVAGLIACILAISFTLFVPMMIRAASGDLYEPSENVMMITHNGEDIIVNYNIVAYEIDVSHLQICENGCFLRVPLPRKMSVYCNTPAPRLIDVAHYNSIDVYACDCTHFVTSRGRVIINNADSLQFTKVVYVWELATEIPTFIPVEHVIDGILFTGTLKVFHGHAIEGGGWQMVYSGTIAR